MESNYYSKILLRNFFYHTFMSSPKIKQKEIKWKYTLYECGNNKFTQLGKLKLGYKRE